MPKITGMENLQKTLQRVANKSREARTSVVVGFSQRYAIYVHENLGSHHPVGQAKFLEQPARTMGPELARVIKEVYAKTGSMRQALLLAGLRLQREAQLLTPVDTSALKASAYTAEESEAENVAVEAFNRSESLRMAKIKKKGG